MEGWLGRWLARWDCVAACEDTLLERFGEGNDPDVYYNDCSNACYDAYQREPYARRGPAAEVGRRIAGHWLDQHGPELPGLLDQNRLKLPFYANTQDMARYGGTLAFGMGLAALTVVGWRLALVGGLAGALALYLGNKLLESQSPSRFLVA